MSAINEFLSNPENTKSKSGNLRGHIIRCGVECVDGFKMSVQASEYHYCEPRETIGGEYYTAVEIGFPSQEEPLLMPYAESPEEPTQTVYGWVPVETVNEVIKKHGGIKS